MRRLLLGLLTSCAIGCGGASSDSQGSAAPGSPTATPSTPPSTIAPTPTSSPLATPEPVARWRAFGPEAGRAWSIAVDGGDPDVIYAGTERGVYKSIDAGAQWAFSGYGMSVTAGTPDLVAALAAHRTRSGLLYAATRSGEAGVPGEPTGVWRSIDGGATWNAIDAGLRLDDGSARFVAVLDLDPTSGDTVYVGGQGLHRSLDGGATWTQLLDMRVTSVGVDPSDGSKIFVGGDRVALLSEDGGATWSDLGSPFDEYSWIGSNVTTAFAFAPSDRTVVYAGLGERGVARSLDAGRTWAKGGALGSTVDALAVDVADPSIVHAATTGGYWRSEDGGTSWENRRERNAPWSHALQIVTDPRRPDRLLMAFAVGGVLLSADGGRSTFARLREGFGPAQVRAVAVDPFAPEVVLTGTHHDGVFKSVDRGRSWTDVSAQIGWSSSGAIAFDNTARGTIHVSSFGNFLSTTYDGGGSWLDVPLSAAYPSSTDQLPAPPFGIAVDPSGSGTIIAAQGLPSISLDGGETFAPIIIPPPPGPNVFPEEWCGCFLAAAIDAGPPQTMYLHAGDQVIRSVDGGRSWLPELSCPRFGPRAFPPGFPTGVIAQTSVPGLVYATSSLGVLRSDDAGASWIALSEDVLGWVYSLALDPRDRDALYAGTRDRGVFRSGDRGATWEKVGDGLDDLPVVALTVEPITGSTIYAAIDRLGISVLDLPE